MTKQSTYWKFVTAFVVIMVVAAGSYFIWNKYFKYDQEKVYKEAKQKYIAAMTADTYGGKTPKETLDLFVDALRKGDVELASKYFLLDTNSSIGNIKNYLTRKKWEGILHRVKENGQLTKIVAILEKAKPAGSAMEGYFGFEARDDKNNLIADINMRFNRYSGVWKIESL